MILTRTPMRISLAGGGTDMPGFYTRQTGAVVSFAIDKYMYISVNPKFNGRTRVSYFVTEDVEDPKHLKHDLARETLAFFNMTGVEITSVSDIPDGGSGLGSSSVYAVGLTLALSAYRDAPIPDPDALAHRAYHIERTYCSHPVGRQDHWAAAHGGLHFYKFFRDGTVAVEGMNIMLQKQLARELMLFFTGSSRIANQILKAQEDNFRERPESFIAGMKIRDLAVRLAKELNEGRLDNLGDILDAGWRYKKQMAEGITHGWIDDLYEKAKRAGATGGKLLGAGGGGFFLFAVPESRRADVEKATGLKHVPFKIEPEGSKVVYQ